MSLNNSVVTPDTAIRNEDKSIWDDPTVLGGLIGGILAFILLVIIAVVVGVTIAKRRAAASTSAPTTGEGDVQLTPTNSSLRTSTYGSIQSVLPSNYGESKFADLD